MILCAPTAPGLRAALGRLVAVALTVSAAPGFRDDFPDLIEQVSSLQALREYAPVDGEDQQCLRAPRGSEDGGDALGGETMLDLVRLQEV